MAARTILRYDFCGYDIAAIRQFVDHAASSLGIVVKPGEKLLLKPNLLQPPRGTSDPVVTSSAVILAVADYFRDHTRHVFVGDSPALGTAHLVLDRMGILGDLQRRGVKVLEFRETVSVAGLPRLFRIARAALEVDAIVNVPKLKVHRQTLFSGAIKNLYGFVVGKRKTLLHFLLKDALELLDCLYSLSRLLPIRCNLLDAIQMMNRDGPTRGVAHPSGMMAAAMRCDEMDALICRLLTLDPQGTCYCNALKDIEHSVEKTTCIIEGVEVPGQTSLRLCLWGALRNCCKHWILVREAMRKYELEPANRQKSPQ